MNDLYRLAFEGTTEGPVQNTSNSNMQNGVAKTKKVTTMMTNVRNTFLTYRSRLELALHCRADFCSSLYESICTVTIIIIGRNEIQQSNMVT